MIYISTGGSRVKSGYAFASELMQAGFDAVELSGGIPDDTQLEKLKLLRQNILLQVHNYFPPPAEPFVMNLASLDETIVIKSIEQIKKSIHWAIELGNPVYSFHAGFLFDPQPGDLGNRIEKKRIFDREKALELFIKRVKTLAVEYEKKGVTLLIENNVLSKKNLDSFGMNPFLLVDSNECRMFMNEMPGNVELLIDVAHLNVSAASLGFEREKMLKECATWTYAYHLSDNDGISDNNSAIGMSSWFWPHLKPDVNFYVLEVYNTSFDELHEQVSIVSTTLKKNAK